jgi:hypothetical protein
MSTKKKTQTTGTFDAAGQSAYNNLQPSITSGLQENMNNPWQAIGGNQQLAQANQSIFNSTQQNNQDTVKSLTDRGISTNSPLFAQQVAQSSQTGQRQQQGAYNNLLLTAGNVATGGATAASQYQPQQTGNTQTSWNSGLGTWLPQVLALGAKAAGGAAGA